MTFDLFGASSGAFNAFDKDGDGIIKLNVLEVIKTMGITGLSDVMFHHFKLRTSG